MYVCVCVQVWRGEIKNLELEFMQLLPVFVCEREYVHVHMCVGVSMCVRESVYMCARVYEHVCVCNCVSVCVHSQITREESVKGGGITRPPPNSFQPPPPLFSSPNFWLTRVPFWCMF